jgi:hypothetical protein
MPHVVTTPIVQICKLQQNWLPSYLTKSSAKTPEPAGGGSTPASRTLPPKKAGDKGPISKKKHLNQAESDTPVPDHSELQLAHTPPVRTSHRTRQRQTEQNDLQSSGSERLTVISSRSIRAAFLRYSGKMGSMRWHGGGGFLGPTEGELGFGAI